MANAERCRHPAARRVEAGDDLFDGASDEPLESRVYEWCEACGQVVTASEPPQLALDL